MAKYRMGGKIGNSNNGNINNKEKSTSDFASRMNKLYGGNKTNFGHMLDNFRKEYANSDTEHAITVDKDGFAHSLSHGGKHSVSPAGSIDNMFLIHNHPSDSNFSRQDLLVTAEKKSLGIVATGKSGDYIFIKKSNFNAREFLNALNKTNDIVNTFTVNQENPSSRHIEEFLLERING